MAESSHDADRQAADRQKAERSFAERVVRYLDDALPAEELNLLNRELAADAGRRERFVELCIVESMVAEEFSQRAGGGRAAAAADDASGFSDLVALSAGAVDADAWQIAPRSRMRTPWLAGGLAAAASVLIAAGVAWHSSRPAAVSPPIVAVAPLPMVAPTPASAPAPVVTVASLGDTRDTAWDGPAVQAGSRFVPGTTLSLTHGVATVTFDRGTTMVIEGPARLTVDSPTALTLASGRVVATAVGGGFVVNTPHAVVTDLGTEFGVVAKPAGGTRVEVFRGSVRVDAVGAAAGASLTLGEGDAADVAAGTPVRDAGGAVPQHFVRALSNPWVEPVTLDVVDLVAGGDGHGHRRDKGIDVLTGRAATTQVSSFTSRHAYQRAADVPAVDGAFVPDQSAAPAVVDSAGHTFAFPATDNHSFALLWAGGAVPSLPGYPSRPTTLAGVDYAAPGHGLLAMDSNKGVTFDLNVLRRANPSHEAARFRAAFGNTFPGGRQPPSKADLWVLVDGRVKFGRRAVMIADGAIAVDVALDAGDRFLTLVVTDGGDNYGYDWTLWCDPTLELRPR